jgi:5-formaminoimidazole-4-carboxamide-1-beta-D-ribofuranosyl 5'-monophosphate synthetase
MPTGVIGTECIKFYFYHGEIFYVKDITDKKVAGQNQEVEGHIAGCRLQRKPLTQSR